MALLSSDDEEGAETGVGETSMRASLTNRSILGRLSPRANSFIGPSKFNVCVQLLDRCEKHLSEYKKSATGQNVLEDVCKFLNISEKDFFGLQYDDNKFRYWVDLSKPLSKQFHRKELEFRLRFRFYPPDPFCLKEAVTRYYLFVQIRRDLLHGRLSCSQNEAATLCGLILQACEGDYDEQTMGQDADYVSSYQLVIKQSHKIEEKIAEAHKKFSGLTVEEAETELLNIACKMDTYGFNPQVVKNVSQTEEIVIGATSRGILVYERGRRTHSLAWSEVQKVDYVGKQLTITPSKDYLANIIQSDDNGQNSSSLNASLLSSSDNNEKSKGGKKLKLVCPSATYAKNLWRQILSQEAFFTENRATNVKPRFSTARIPLFSRGSTFRCPTPRVLHELEVDTSPPRPSEERTFERHTLKKYTPRSVEESSWNFSTSGYSKPTTNNNNHDDTFNSSGELLLLPVAESSPAANSTLPVTDDVDAQSPLLDHSEQNGKQNSPLKISLNGVHAEDIREKMVGGFKLFGKTFSGSSIKSGIMNGSTASHHSEHGGYLEENNCQSSALGTLAIVVGVILLICTISFFVAFFFFPDVLACVTSHVPSQIKVPSWLLLSSTSK